MLVMPKDADTKSAKKFEGNCIFSYEPEALIDLRIPEEAM